MIYKGDLRNISTLKAHTPDPVGPTSPSAVGPKPSRQQWRRGFRTHSHSKAEEAAGLRLGELWGALALCQAQIFLQGSMATLTCSPSEAGLAPGPQEGRMLRGHSYLFLSTVHPTTGCQGDSSRGKQGSQTRQPDFYTLLTHPHIELRNGVTVCI